MKLNPPTQVVFLISLLFAVVGILGQFLVPVLAGFAFWAMLIAYVLLFLGNLLKGF